MLERKGFYEKMGVPSLNILKWYRCECSNPDYKKYNLLKADLAKYEDIIKHVNIPEGKYRDFCFDMYKLKIKECVLKLAQNKFYEVNGIKKTGFLFWSNGPGTGKTLLSLSILNSLVVDFKMTARYENTTLLFGTLKKFFNMDRKNFCYNEINYLDQLVDVDILILDDIGTEKASEWVREKLYYVLEGRNMKAEKINLYTSNDSPETLCRKIGDKLVSRIFEYSEAIEFQNEDWRNKK